MSGLNYIHSLGKLGLKDIQYNQSLQGGTLANMIGGRWEKAWFQ